MPCTCSVAIFLGEHELDDELNDDFVDIVARQRACLHVTPVDGAMVAEVPPLLSNCSLLRYYKYELIARSLPCLYLATECVFYLQCP